MSEPIADLVRYGVSVSRLTRGRDEDFQFVLGSYRKTMKAGEWFQARNLRCDGTLIEKPRLKVLGLRGNVKVTAAFFEILNLEGRRDPIGAAHTITAAVNLAVHTMKDLRRMREYMGEDCFAVLQASNMAAGPCDQAKSFADKALPSATAPLLPLDRCTHPGQCGCVYRARESL